MTNKREAMKCLVHDIYEQEGEVKPSVLISMSEAEDSPTHDCFEWDNKEAGHQYRLQQARSWIRRVNIKTDGRVSETRDIYVHIPAEDGGEGAYKPIQAIVNNRSEFERALYSAMSDLEAAKCRVAELRDVADIEKKQSVAHIDTSLAALEESTRALEMI